MNAAAAITPVRRITSPTLFAGETSGCGARGNAQSGTESCSAEPRWRDPEVPAERGDEGAGARVAGLEPGFGDRLARAKRGRAVEQAQALAPLRERQAGLGKEQPLDRARAGAGGAGEVGEA